MANKKYEFIDGDTKVVYGRTLRRIRALATIGLSVSAGDIGGYIESEKNLDVFGDAWVSGNAWVFDNAQVFGDAQVSGTAWVYGNACVFDNAQVSGDAYVSGNALVYGNAQVSGDAWVSGNALVDKISSIFCATNVGTENGTLTVCKGKDGLIVTRGCFKGTTDEFLAKSEKVHDGDTHWEYRLLIEVAKNRITKGEKNNG